MFDTTIPLMANGFSRMDDARIIELEERFGAHHYHRLGVVVSKSDTGQGREETSLADSIQR